VFEGIADVKYVEFAASGHLPNLEEPKKFNQEINSFLRSF
jgi:pimeloyl-ACP methyl ester carboxylesterase